MASDGIDENMECGLGVEAAGLSQRENALDPPVTFFTGGALGSFSPQHGVAQHTLSMIVGGRDSLLNEKHPKMVEFPVEASGKDTCRIFPFMVSGDEVKEPGVEGSPLPYGRCLMSHMSQPLELTHGPFSKLGDLRVLSLREGFGIPNEVSKAGLPQAHPLSVDSVAIAYEDSLPVLDEALEGHHVSIGVDHEEGYSGACHHPKPAQNSGSKPGGLIEVIDCNPSGSVSYGFIMGQDGCRDPIDHLLNGADTNVESKNGGAEGLNRAPAVSLVSCHLGYDCREIGSISSAVLLRNECLVHFPATGTGSLEENEVEDIGLDLGKLDPLMGVVGGEILEIGRTARGAGLRLELLRFSRFKESLPMSFVALFPSGFPVLLPGRLLFEGFIRGRWLA